MGESFRALMLTEADGKVSAAITEVPMSDLPDGDVTVAVEYSDLNYKDGMVVNGIGRLVRTYPHIPGIDFAGTVEESRHPDFKPGDKVVLTGWRVGEIWWGGYAQKARVKGDWLIHLPDGFETKQAMAVGTAGLTAALALIALEREGLTPETDGEVLVTGAAGGVGSVAVALAAASGYRVAASTGRAETHEYLTSLGAAEIVDRNDLSEGPVKPLDRERWAGAIDAVGSTTLAKVLSQMKYRSAVSACGLAGGSDLPATVLPFLLRGVRLIGIDSVMCPIPERREAWAQLAKDLPKDRLDAATSVAPLSDLPDLAGRILKGQVQGRVVIDVNA